ncbi:hypothetical protein EWM64_g699 [Hericium alpestre]|uniref:TMEM205-like domain-containing protein n=1 Tax=Hericium alpestre TaxID=135208 RepID=A0A4Z0A9D7_9AGAM|nr:hypothetical protein EWM64_g699 [Hericium alpestre]
MTTAPPQTLNLSSLLSLLSLDGAYHLGFSFLYGMSVWVTFFGGVIAFKTLPRQQFGALQHRTFPIYFNLSIAITTGLLAAWTLKNPSIISRYTEFGAPDVTQAYALATILVAQALNSLVIGPVTSSTMFARHKLEKEEGKAYNEEGVSEKMKALNKKFARLHGYSSLANLTSVIALTFHGLWVGNYGLPAH